MARMEMNRIKWAAAVLLLAGLIGAYGQSGPVGSTEAGTLVGALGLPQQSAERALKLTDRFIGQTLESGKAMAALLSQQKPERLLDPQMAAKIGQIQKEYGLKLQRFQLDLADIAGESSAAQLVSRLKTAVPSVLLEVEAGPAVGSTPVAAPAAHAMPGAAAGKPQEVPLGNAGAGALDLQVNSPSSGMAADMIKMEQSIMKSMMGMGAMQTAAGTSNMGGMPGMNGSAAAPNSQLTQQLLSTNSLIAQLLATLATSTAPSGVLRSQLQLLNQLLANQASMLQLLAGAAGGSSMPSNSMGGMGKM